MSIGILQDQRGAALAFTLVMLLLLTLVSVSMIQENKTQLAITGNVGDQMKSFARAESMLRVAESIIEAKRKPNLNDETKPDQKDDCSTDASDQFFENSGLAMPTTQATAKITAVYCAINSFEYRCVGENSYTAQNTESTENVTACAKLTSSQCPTEVYTIDVTFTDDLTTATRSIRSKFSVGCSVFA